MGPSKLVAIVTSFAAIVSASCLHGLHRRDSSAVFGYTGTNGPINWGDLPDSDTCETGTNQSPINVDSSIQLVVNKPNVTINYVNSAILKNLGTTLQVELSGTTVYENKIFNLLQYHFHTPSEHRLNDEYFPLEMHMVHQADDQSLLVLTFLFQLDPSGMTKSFLSRTIENIESIGGPGTQVQTGALQSQVVVPLIQHLQDFPIKTYSGSLTTPPCSQGVTFLLSTKSMPMSVWSYNVMKSVMKYNARYLQNQPGQPNLIALACSV